MIVKILGVCGSPRLNSNSLACTAEALKAARAVSGVKTELIDLAKLKINHCVDCGRCAKQGTRRNPCPQFGDDMTPLYQKITSADGFIFTSPAYYGGVSSLMKTFLDRFRPFSTGFYRPHETAEFKDTLRLKPAGAIAVGGGRNDGIESAITNLRRAFSYHDMIIVGSQFVRYQGIPRQIGFISSWGGSVHSGSQPKVVERDLGGLLTVRILGGKVAAMAKAMKPIRSKLRAEYAKIEAGKSLQG